MPSMVFALLVALSSSMELYYDHQCYDGSYVTNSLYCPNENNGCPFFASYRCSTGDCVGNYWDCPKVQCEAGKVLCNDGFCHNSIDDCSTINVFGCTGSMVRCVNGECSESCAEQLNACIGGLFLCPSGQCVSNGPKDCLDLPEETYANCDILALQHDIKGTTRLRPCTDGSCIHVTSACPALNPDSLHGHYPCGDKVFRASTANCPVACPQGLQRCVDGSCSGNGCVNTVSPALLKTRSDKCGAGETLCAGECITGDCAATRTFPLFKCPDGSFANSSFAPLAEDNACIPKIRCPMNYPHLCEDNSCAADSASCRVNTCGGYRCTNGKCVDAESECEAHDLMCPQEVPVLCHNGNCVKSIQECRILIATSTLLNSKESCGTKVKCHDGSCVRDASDCIAISTACDPTTAGYRCPDSNCAADANSCAKATKRCYYDQMLCLDQTCAKSCLPINGCSIQRPFQCPNGPCVYSYSECLGRSRCSASKPYQCASMSCVESPNVCESPVWMMKPLNLMLTLHANLPKSFDVCETAKPEGCAVVYVPAGTELCTGKECYKAVIVRPVADSVLRELRATAENGAESHMRENVHVGYSDVDGVALVKSPVLNVTGPNGAFSFSSPIRLKLYTDVNLTTDYCLGEVNLPSKTWGCYQRIANSSNHFWVSSTGIYAIVYSPVYTQQKSEVSCAWPCSHPDYFVLSVVGGIVLVVGLALMLWMVAGAKEKSREARRKVLEAHRRIEELTLGRSIINISTYTEKKEDALATPKENEELKEVEDVKLEVKEQNDFEAKKEDESEYKLE